MDEAAIRAAFEAACLEELEALKPGNVHIYSGGHGMDVEDFRRAARAAAPEIARRGAGVGARVLAAVEASWAAVPKNTNLGILLLCAPLALAAERGGDLRASLAGVLAGLDRSDAELAFRAIARASPGGLGTAPAHDVRDPPDATLLQAMQAAQGRDRIAWQYANGFADVFDVILLAPEGRARMWPAVSAYLAFLSSHPDSHLQRKFGEAVARQVQDEARPLRKRLALAVERSDFSRLLDRLSAFDKRLKAAGLNPGTSADLTVAALFANKLAAHRHPA